MGELASGVVAPSTDVPPSPPASIAVIASTSMSPPSTKLVPGSPQATAVATIAANASAERV
jgi:hypothetical protein